MSNEKYEYFITPISMLENILSSIYTSYYSTTDIIPTILYSRDNYEVVAYLQNNKNVNLKQLSTTIYDTVLNIEVNEDVCLCVVNGHNEKIGTKNKLTKIYDSLKLNKFRVPLMCKIFDKLPINTIVKCPEIMYKIIDSKLHIFIDKNLIHGYKLPSFTQALFEYSTPLVKFSIFLKPYSKKKLYPITNVLKKLKKYIIRTYNLHSVPQNKIIVIYDNNFIDDFLTVIITTEKSPPKKLPYIPVDKQYYIQIGFMPIYIDKLYRFDMSKFKDVHIQLLDKFFSIINN